MRYIKTKITKTEILKIRLDEEQKNYLTRLAFNENKTVTQCVLDALKKKEKNFPL